MKFYSIETGNFKLDGGAMFGVVPKNLWNNIYPADENNLCNLSIRCLLVETDNKLVLIDTGLGKKQSDKFFGYYSLNGSASLESSLKAAGYEKSDITDVLLTHLHFDHCGGAIEIDRQNKHVPAFPNANYWISGPQWHWAMNPNQREKASYLVENFEPLESTGKLNIINSEGSFTPDIVIRFFNGHTNGLIVPFINTGEQTMVYVSDLIPTTAHIPLSWICGFDTRPLISMDEKRTFLQEALNNNYVLFFEHDILNECCSLIETEKGIRMKESFTLKKFIQSRQLP
jgi:glyoxylase-like metal-dependent hydrolase (beta-lactamase superfamily II)